MCRVTRLSPARFRRATALGNGTVPPNRSSEGFSPTPAARLSETSSSSSPSTACPCRRLGEGPRDESRARLRPDFLRCSWPSRVPQSCLQRVGDKGRQHVLAQPTSRRLSRSSRLATTSLRECHLTCRGSQTSNTYARPAKLAWAYAPTTTVVPEVATE